jgi:hypothetical protein
LSTGRISLLHAQEGRACCARSLSCFLRNAIASVACALARPMRAPSSCVGAKSISSSPSPSDRGSAYVSPSVVSAEVGPPELRISEGVRCECARSTVIKPVFGLAIVRVRCGRIKTE